MFNTKQLRELGFIPGSNYKLGQAFPKNFELPLSVTPSDWKKLPLYIQVRYEYSNPFGEDHIRKE